MRVGQLIDELEKCNRDGLKVVFCNSVDDITQNAMEITSVEMLSKRTPSGEVFSDECIILRAY